MITVRLENMLTGIISTEVKDNPDQPHTKDPLLIHEIIQIKRNMSIVYIYLLIVIHIKSVNSVCKQGKL